MRQSYPILEFDPAPEAIIEPHSGVGGRMPAPIKDRPAVRGFAHIDATAFSGYLDCVLSLP